MALFIFFTRTARTRVVTSDFLVVANERKRAAFARFLSLIRRRVLGFKRRMGFGVFEMHFHRRLALLDACTLPDLAEPHEFRTVSLYHARRG